jgi:DNA-binding Lrp family transcriptional regulator
MYNLDVKERKILYQLDIDSRQSFRSIGRKVGLSKDVVSSRVKKLQENGVIRQFYPIINPMRMGYTWLRLYFLSVYNSEDQEANY